MPRLLLTDEYWSKLKPILLDYGIYDKPELHLTVEGILYRLRVGCLWRDLPEYFGRWNRSRIFSQDLNTSVQSPQAATN